MHNRSSGVHTWLSDRERGFKSNDINTQLYSSIACVGSWNSPKDNHGGIFNFDFSPDGSVLVTACERASLLVFDPYNAKLLSSRKEAHADCVNCVRFLDSRVFATCSDDTTVCLWDTRYLKHKLRTLRGHSNWVKNIEYCSRSELLVTSGFDGSIYTWDINKYSETECAYERVFHTNGLMRAKLAPDCDRLVITTSAGFMLIVHDLHLASLAHDLRGFKPTMYRFMQVDQSPLRYQYLYDHVFSAARNRVELVSDFPLEEDKAEMIASLEVHPQGWCVVSRNTSSDESSEWTCVHDVQGYAPPEDDVTASDERRDVTDSDTEDVNDDVNFTVVHDSSGQPQAVHAQAEVHLPPMAGFVTASGDAPPLYGLPAHAQGPSSFRLAFTMPDSPRTPSSPSVVVSPIEYHNEDDEVEAAASSSADNNSEVNSNARSQEDSNPRSQEDWTQYLHSPPDTAVAWWGRPRSDNSLRQNAVEEAITYVLRTYNAATGQRYEHSEAVEMYHRAAHRDPLHPDCKIRQNRKRLLHYIEEPNVGRGFIKEVCFNNDGRLIASPFGFGIRMLAFDAACGELCDSVPASPRQLHEVAANMSHTATVVTCKFSPTHCLCVSGCLNGKVDFHQPRL